MTATSETEIVRSFKKGCVMQRSRTFVWGLALVTVSVLGQVSAKDYGLSSGSPDMQSAGALAFGPEGILLVGDSKGAAIFAIDTEDTTAPASPSRLNIAGIDTQVAALLGAKRDDISINDLAVNPLSHAAYLSVSRGSGPDAIPVILRVDPSGGINEVDTANVKFAKATLENPPESGGTGRRNKRADAVTDLLYHDGQVFVAGLSNEEFSSKLRSLPFPFGDQSRSTSVEIYHGAHGRWETNSPVRTFATYEIEDKPHLLAAYTCTPLVKIPIDELKPGAKIVGDTVAELGNRNRPLDMFVYTKGGHDYILMANSSRGMMKIDTQDISRVESIKEHVEGGGTAGLTYNTINQLKGVEQLDRLDEGHALILVANEDGTRDLRTVELP
jgi:hypothetical protein